MKNFLTNKKGLRVYNCKAQHGLIYNLTSVVWGLLIFVLQTECSEKSLAWFLVATDYYRILKEVSSDQE